MRRRELERGLPPSWTRAGSLYVLSDQVVLRVSVGGVTDEEERIRRSQTLAQAALSKLKVEK